MVRHAVEQGADLVLSAGGHGTVMAVSRGLAGSGFPLGLLPMDTGNLHARNLDLPLELEAALDVALDGRSRRLDHGHAEHRAGRAAGGLRRDWPASASTRR